MSKQTRGILVAAVLLLFLIRMPVAGVLVLLASIAVETFLFCRRFGRRGLVAFSCLVAAFVLFVSFQGYVLWVNLRLIAEIERRGASSAGMSGNLLPGPVNYISFGPDVGDDELELILALDGLENLEYVVAKGSRITDDGLLMLQRFRKLEHIYIGETKVTGDGVTHLQSAVPSCLIVFEPDG